MYNDIDYCLLVSTL